MGSLPPSAQFDIIICGAGIAGLCAGIGLAQQGHRVTILEAAHALSPVGIGLHIPPNATLVLKRFGLLEKLAENAIYPTGFVFRRGDDSSVIASTPGPAAKGKDGLPYWSMTRANYQHHLYEGAIAAGCDVRLSSRVQSMDEAAPSITLSTGETLKADLIVAADGVKSKLRSIAIPEENVSVVLNPLASYRGLVRKSSLLSDPLTAPFFSGPPMATTWSSYNRSVIIYPCSDDLYTVGATHPAPETATTMDWASRATIGQAQADFSTFDPVVNRILSYITDQDVKQWRLAEVPQLPRWTSTSGRVVLMGDAAHGMLPMLAQGAAMATEDAAALTECLATAQTPTDIPSRMRAFERVRRWRCEVVQAQTRRNAHMVHLGDGEEQENRDRAFRGEEQTGIWKADAGPMFDPEFRKVLYGHNVIEHSRKVLKEMGFC